MNLDKLINEMGRKFSLEPSSEKDVAILKKLQKLYKNDPKEFAKKLRKINSERKSQEYEGYKIKPLNKEEILNTHFIKDLSRFINIKDL